MKRILILSLWCLMLVACESQKVTVITAIPAPTTTLVPVMYPNKLSVVGSGRIKFDNWRVSFSLPKDWDFNKHELGFEANPYTELYLFPGNDYSTEKAGYPELWFLFRPLVKETDKNKFLKTISNFTDDPKFKIDKTYSPTELGLNLDTAVGYKCYYRMNELHDKTCYVIHAVYDNKSVEIQMVADTKIFSKVDEEFLEIIKSISFEQ